MRNKSKFILLTLILLFFFQYAPKTLNVVKATYTCAELMCPGGPCCNKFYNDDPCMPLFCYVMDESGEGSCTHENECLPQPTGGWTCFPAGTKIQMASENQNNFNNQQTTNNQLNPYNQQKLNNQQDWSVQKNIEDVKVGDRVVSQSERGEKSVSTVTKLDQPIRDHMCQIDFTDGSTIKLTSEHPLFSDTGWKAIDPKKTFEEIPSLPVTELKKGDKVVKSDNTEVEVKSFACWSQQIQTYNLILDGGVHTYFADGLLAHNKDPAHCPAGEEQICPNYPQNNYCAPACIFPDKWTGSFNVCGVTPSGYNKYWCSSCYCGVPLTPIPTPPPCPAMSCTGAYPESSITNRTTDTFYAYATGVTNADSVSFPTWSSVDGQDDIVWYQGMDMGGGTWRGSIDLGTHSAGAGTINVHVYLNNCSYTNVWCNTANFVIDQTPPTCTVSGPATNCRGASATYSMVGSDTNYTKGQVYKAPAGTQLWVTPAICNPASGNCSGSTTFSPSGNYDVVCNAYDSAGNQCSGNPTPQSGWADCGASSRMTVTVTDPPAEITCASLSCHTDIQYPPDGTCTGTYTCTSNAPANVTCASLACHTNTQNVDDGNCGTHACTSNAPPAVACPTYCGYPGGDIVPDGDCTTTTCPAVPDNSPPGVPVPTGTTANCSGSMAFSWNPVTDTGCYQNVDYWLQINDSTASWPVNGWVSAISWPSNGWAKSGANPIVVGLASPVVGRVYKAQIKSSDNGASHTNQSAWSAGALWTTGVRYCCPATPTLVSPIGSTCNGPTFPPTYTWNAVTGASGYNLTISKGGIACFSGAVGNFTTASPDVSGCTATGTYTWTVQATYDGGCAPSSPSAAGSFDYDKTAPPIPAGRSITYSPDTECLGKYYMGYSWNAVTDNAGDCAGLHPTPYWAQGSTSAAVDGTGGFTSVITDWYNSWTYPSPLSQLAPTSFPPNTNLYFHVRSRDVLNNQSAWSATDSVVIPVPSPYPTIHIEGPINEDLGDTCYPMSITGTLTFNPSFSPPLKPGSSYSCTAAGATYSCDITIDNTNGECISPLVDITMEGAYSGYDSVEWRDTTDCATNVPTTINTSSVPASAPIYLTYSSGGAGGWFKMKDTAFNSRQSGRQDTIPNNVRAYDTIDDTDVSHKVLSGNSGLLVQDGALDPGGNAYVGGVLTYSTNNWFTTNYGATNDVSYSKYIDYIKARKDPKIITSLSEITTDGIYSISSPITLSASQFDGKKVVLVVQGATATFASNFIPSGGSVAVLAQNIDIDPSVTEIDAILIGQTVTTGVSENGLKIKGNLIDESALSVERTQSDGRMPSFFVVFDVQLYLNLLPYLSTSTYDWKQIQ